MNNSQNTKFHFRRFEFKYHLSKKMADIISADFLKNSMIYDPHALDCVEKSYTVASLYLDSPSLKCYYEKIHGLKNRFKLRFRIYKNFLEEGDNVFLEIKRKNDMAVFKNRAVLSFEAFKEFLAGKTNFDRSEISKQNQKTLNEFLWKKNRYCMLPMFYVRYMRKPMISKSNDRFRVTFDSKISAGYTEKLSSCKDISEVTPGLTVMEVKYDNSLPHWFLEIIQRYQLDRRPFSKYCSAVEICKKYNQF